MKRIIFILLGSVFFYSCNISNKGDSKNQFHNNDSLEKLSIAIRQVKIDEATANDSIKKYLLDSINNRCKILMYALYENDTLFGKKGNEIHTIRECNIRLVNFQNNSSNLKTLHYDYFFEDSIPLLWKFDISKFISRMIHSFEIDLTQKKIVKALISEDRYMEINLVEHIYDSLRKNQ